MRSIIPLVMLSAVLMFFVGSAVTQEFMVYPAKGQSQEQMEWVFMVTAKQVDL